MPYNVGFEPLPGDPGEMRRVAAQLRSLAAESGGIARSARVWGGRMEFTGPAARRLLSALTECAGDSQRAGGQLDRAAAALERQAREVQQSMDAYERAQRVAHERAVREAAELARREASRG